MDIDYAIESYTWLRSVRGVRFVRRLERLVRDHGPTETLSLVLHPRMPDDTRACYGAAVDYLAATVSVASPPPGLAT